MSIIGRGNTGYVIRPSKTCKSPNISFDDYKVSKIVDTETYDKEIKINEQLRTIPNLENFAIILHENEKCSDCSDIAINMGIISRPVNSFLNVNDMFNNVEVDNENISDIEMGDFPTILIKSNPKR